MARIRYNNSAGQLGSLLAADVNATTLDFGVAPPFATVAAPNYVAIVLDPPQGAFPSPNFEVVYLTAYTAGATTGTVARAQEGSSAVLHNAGAIWAVAPTASDLMGTAPVGAIVPYAGSGDPPETNWVIADGRLIDRTINADFFARVGHAYNGGVDPGSNKVKIPDKRGKSSIGAINMGSTAGAGPNDNSHYQGVRGASFGEVQHTLQPGEGSINSNAGFNSMGTESADHTHTTSGQTGTESANHYHFTTLNMANAGNVVAWSSGPAWNAPGTGLVAYESGYEQIAHSHAWSGASGGRSAAHSHALLSRIADTAHNTVHPVEPDCYIVRIA